MSDDVGLGYPGPALAGHPAGFIINPALFDNWYSVRAEPVEDHGGVPFDKLRANGI